jgi:hypothetical protein
LADYKKHLLDFYQQQQQQQQQLGTLSDLLLFLV